MSYDIIYKTIFEVSILHGYFLNNGIEEYNSMTDVQKKKMLKNYNFENFLKIVPTKETSRLLKNNHLLLTINQNTLRVGTRVSNDDLVLPFSNISLGLNLNFTIKINDAFFENYTDIGLSEKQILYLSNVKPEDEPVSFKYIPVVSENLFIDEDYKISKISTKKVLENLEAFEKNGLIGMISIAMKADNSALDILTIDKKIKTPTPIFKLHFNNRKTFWKYIKTNINFEVETTIEKPLTQNGFVEIVPTDFTTNPPQVSDFQYPNPSVKSIHKILTKTYSQIFI